MAKPAAASITIISLLTLSISIIPSVRSQLSVSPILTACPGLIPKSSKITVYVQSDRTGPNEDLYFVTQSPITPPSISNFGAITVADDKVTAGPDYNSQELGRAQGTITAADLSVLALAFNLNFYFTGGIYNGSTISVLGRNPVFGQQTHELSVVGGTGIFRCASGYVTVTSYSVDTTTLDNVYVYDFYVNYYSI